MIVKNEAHVIARCLRSVKPYIDSYSISDTGSTDSTMDIIRAELANIPGTLTSDPWLGFGPSRNVALRRATGTHVLFIDADEVLEHLEGPLDLNPEFDGFYLQQMRPEMTFWVTRIIRNDSRWSWVGKLHEYLSFDNAKHGRITNFQIRPYFDSQRNVSGNKFLSDLAHFESDERTPRNVFYHAQTLRDMGGRKEEAIQKYLERSAMGGWEEEVYYSLWQAAALMEATGRPSHEVAAAYYGAYFYRPSRFEALRDLCRLLRKYKRWEEIYHISSLNIRPSENILFIDPRAPRDIYLEHAQAAHHLGMWDEAKEYFTRAATIAPQVSHPQDLVNLSLIYYLTQRYNDCIAAAQEALKLRPDYPEAYNNIAAAHMAQAEWDLAIEASVAALHIQPDFQLAKNNLKYAIAEKSKLTTLDDAPRYSTDWFDQNIDNWSRELSSLRSKPGLRFLEIGCFEGRATRWTLDNILTDQTSTIEVIDTFEGSAEHHNAQFARVVSTLRQTFDHNVKPFTERVHVHQGRSHDVLPQIAPNRQAYYDFIYVDGSHHQDDVYKDAVLTWPLLKAGAILAFDDYEWWWIDPDTGERQAPKIGIHRFLDEHEGEYELLLKGWQLHIRKTA